MAEECVVAVYDDVAGAKAAIGELIADGFAKEHISLVTGSLKGEPAAVRRALELGDETEKDAAIGAGIGGLVGLLGGATVVSMAGAGVVIAGPLGALTGAVVGGVVGAIRGWSVHKDHIPKYEEKVHSGQVLVIVHHTDPLKIANAEKVLQATPNVEVSLHARVDDGDDRSVDDIKL
jgi:outer membrane lipoprotein SlyB